MSEHLDDWLAELAAAPADRSLEGLEAAICRDIAAFRREARTVKALAPVRLATVGLALAMGLTAGGAATTAALNGPHAGGAFVTATELAPSTLLEGVG